MELHKPTTYKYGNFHVSELMRSTYSVVGVLHIYSHKDTQTPTHRSYMHMYIPTPGTSGKVQSTASTQIDLILTANHPLLPYSDKSGRQHTTCTGKNTHILQPQHTDTC